MENYYLGDVVRKVRPNITVEESLPDTTHKNNLGQIVETFSSGGPIITSQSSGSIVYTRRSKRLPKRSNLCAHTVTSLKMTNGGALPVFNSADLNPAHVGWTWQSYWDYVSSYNAHVAALPIGLAQLGSNGLGKLQANWKSYAGTGFRALQPDLTQLSLPNFLVDIKQIGKMTGDIRPLIGQATKTEASVLKQTFHIGQALPANLRKADRFKTAAKLAAEKRLAYKFGWKPTIGDVRNMLNAVIDLDLRLQAFKNAVGKEQSFTKTIEKVDTWKVGQFNLNGDIHYQVNWAGYLTGKVQYNARYRCEPLLVLGELDEMIRAVLDHFGVELNPQILWDAIPFSFVLDWFTGFGNWLGQYKVDALNLPISLLDSAVSYKEKYQVGSAVVLNPNGYPTDVTSTTKPSGYVTERTFFHRLPVDPTITTFRELGWRNPTGSQWTNLVSLATVLAL